MKQVLMMIMGIGVFSVSAKAVVLFTATDDGCGKLRIGYHSPDGDAPRGVSLRVSCSDGAVVDLAATAAAKSWDPAFNIFVEYAYSYPNYMVGDGHPLANATEPGALTTDASRFAINMGVLDLTGGHKPGPVSTPNLITLQLKMGFSGMTTVTISADTLRGPASGVIGSVLASNLPIRVQVDGDCVPEPATMALLGLGMVVMRCKASRK